MYSYSTYFNIYWYSEYLYDKGEYQTLHAIGQVITDNDWGFEWIRVWNLTLNLDKLKLELFVAQIY